MSVRKTKERAINSFLIVSPLFCEIPPNLPLPKGGIKPLFGKEGLGEIY